MTWREQLAAWLAGPEKAATGIGATWMTHKPPLSAFQKDPRKAFGQAQQLGIGNPYIRASERVIGDKFSTVPWHLEQGDDQRVESGPVLDLLQRPYRPAPEDPRSATPRTRSALWRITSRHMGTCGIAFWYLDQSDALDGFPLSILYINPMRLAPAEDKMGNLIGWVLDPDAYGKGTPLEIDKVVPFRLEPADRGHYGIGLVESAFSRIEMMRLSDHHANEVLASGGRLAGVFSPPAAAGPIPEDQYEQLVKDIRTVVERPDAARRSLILKGPIEFDRTTANPSELDLTAISELGRDGILDLWGVPLSQLSGTGPAGLNSGAKGENEEASLWQNAVGPRLRSFAETLQMDVLDRLGEKAPKLVIEEPEFDDKEPQYDMAAKARELPLTNEERRDLVGLEPTGDEDFDKAVWQPISLTETWVVGQGEPEKPEPVMPRALQEEQDEAVKARAVPGQDRIRATTTKKMRDDLGRVFDKMQSEVAAKVKKNAGHLETHPADDSVWWDGDKWERELMQALRPHALNAADDTVEKVDRLLG